MLLGSTDDEAITVSHASNSQEGGALAAATTETTTGIRATSSLARIAAWDKWCETDYVRNGIVIPHLNRLMVEVMPKVITDVGCGSGYISRALLQAQPERQAHWLLVDSNAKALMYAHDSMVTRATRACIETFHLDITRHIPSAHLASADLAFMAFTLLEFRVTPIVAANLQGMLRTGGRLSIFMPDGLWDVCTRGQGLETVSKYLHGCVELRKKRLPPSSRYRFHANRIEMLLQLLTAASLNLISLTMHQRPEREPGDTIIALDFTKI